MPRRKKRPLKAELVSRLSLLEQKVQTLSGENGIDFAPADSQDNSQTTGLSSTENQASYLGEAGEQNTETGEKLDSIKGTISKGESQFGRLVVRKGKWTSRYVNHQALVNLGDQVIYTSLPLNMFGPFHPLKYHGPVEDQGTSRSIADLIIRGRLPIT
jgi:hypothetical protein